MKVTRTFSFDSEKHSDVLGWLDRQENASEAIRDAIRCAMDQENGITLADIYHELLDLKRQGVAIRDAPEQQPEPDTRPERTEADANIDALLGL